VDNPGLAYTEAVKDAIIDAMLSYSQRLVLGPENSVMLPDDSVEPLQVPSGQQSGVKLTVRFDVQPGTTKDVYVDFDAHRSVFVHEAGRSGKYLLRPTVRAYDRLETGTISGRLTDAATLAPLPGVLVTAQTLDSGGPAIAREVWTRDDGRYEIDLVPRDVAYHVVAQPVRKDAAGATTAVYAARASPPIAVTTGNPTPAWDAAFDISTSAGAVTGKVMPVASESQADLVEIRQSLPAGATAGPFIVRTVVPTVDTTVDPGVETWSVADLPAASYSAIARRRTMAADGVERTTWSGEVGFAVPTGGAAVDLAFPP
jgi:hypothetical protein